MERGFGATVSSTRWIEYGRVTARVRSGASARGVVSSFILRSSEGDEVDFLFVGANRTAAQTNYYYDGIEDYTHMHSSPALDAADAFFYDYTIDWTPASITWLVNGQPIRTVRKADTWNEALRAWMYPSRASRIQLSIWDGGNSGRDGTMQWAGTPTDWASHRRFQMEIAQVKIECYRLVNATATVDPNPQQQQQGSNPQSPPPQIPPQPPVSPQLQPPQPPQPALQPQLTLQPQPPLQPQTQTRTTLLFPGSPAASGLAGTTPAAATPVPPGATTVLTAAQPAAPSPSAVGTAAATGPSDTSNSNNNNSSSDDTMEDEGVDPDDLAPATLSPSPSSPPSSSSLTKSPPGRPGASASHRLSLSKGASSLPAASSSSSSSSRSLSPAARAVRLGWRCAAACILVSLLFTPAWL
ncbi:concanavalin A-like lectin/glucanase [Ramicandelaber brevisporus]|nr:concanavalin A-like lectin/glucanase [Ramicandelaber brevisporus]